MYSMIYSETLPRFRRKKRRVTGFSNFANSKDDATTNRISDKMSCMTHVTIEKRTALPPLETRSTLPTKPGPPRRFKAAKNRTFKFKVDA